MPTLLLLASLLVQPPTVDFIRANASPFSQPDLLPAAVSAAVDKFHVISVGEIHGSDEAPRFVLGLLRLLRARGKTVLLGLEMPADEQPAIDKYLATGDLAVLRESPFFRREFQDGRSSRAMARLLGEVRALSGVKVYGFDATDVVSDQDRDEKMARNLKGAMGTTPTDAVVFLAGNIHAAAAVGSPFDPKFRPMGYELGLKDDELLPIKVRNQSGETWCCLGPAKGDCKTHPMEYGKSTYSEALSSDFYFVPEKDLFEGYRATFFVRRLAPSLPLGG